MRLLAVLPLAALALAGCTDDHPPRMVSVCTRSHVETQMVMTFGGMGAAMGGVPIGGDMHLVPQLTTVCEARAWACDHGGRDFRGDRTCPAQPTEKP